MDIADELTHRIKAAAPDEADDFGIVTSRLDIPESPPMTIHGLAYQGVGEETLFLEEWDNGAFRTVDATGAWDHDTAEAAVSDFIDLFVAIYEIEEPSEY